jgi:hypothetical protein
MTKEKLIRRLARRARMEPPPHVDIAGRVMALVVAEGDAKPAGRDPLTWIAAFSAAAAASVALLALSTWTAWAHSFPMRWLLEVPWEGLR